MADPISVIKTVWDAIPKEAISATVTWLLKGSPLVLRILFIVFLVISIVLGLVVWQNASATNETMMRALGSPLEATPHPNTAIETLLLASILKPPPVSEQARGSTTGPPKAPPPFSKAFEDELEKFQQSLANAVTKVDKGPPGAQTRDKADINSIKLDVLPGDSGESLSTRILSDEYDGFLFIPGKILNNNGLPAKDVLSLNKNDNPALFKDIKLSEAVATDLCQDLPSKFGSGYPYSVGAFENSPGFIDDKYRQTYLIFRTGVTRLCETPNPPPATKQREYYADKFPSNTYLQERPYFEPTVESKNSSKGHWTNPYIDLGGNGVVQTYCHYLSAGTEDAIMCFDFSLGADIKTAVRSEVALFGGTATDIKCENKACSSDSGMPSERPFLAKIMGVFYPAARLTSSEEKLMDDTYAALATRNSKATFTGSTTILESDPQSGVVMLLVPTGVDEVLAIKLDLKAYQWWRSLWLFVTAGCATITLLLGVLMFVDYGLKFKEQERAFNAVDTIMTDVPAAYARVGEDGKFVKVNDAFGKLMGYNSGAEALAEVSGFTYEDFLADDESKEEWEKIKLERKDGKRYRSYLVRLWTGGRPGRPPITWVKVHGGDVPTPHSARNKPGQSFGILLRVDAPGPVVMFNSKGESEITDTQASSG